MNYNITYTNTKGVINNNPISFNANDLPLNLNPLVHPEYDFIGWLDTNENIVTQIKNLGDTNLYAVWKDKENFVVMFEENANSDLVTNMPDNVTVYSKENLIISSQIPLRKGYDFVNWNTVKDNTGIKYNPNDTILNIIENKVLYAIWKPQTTKTNLLKYDGNNEGVTNLPENVKFNSGEEIKISKVIPLKDNFMFLNWNTKNDNTGDIIYPNQNITLTNDSTLYANWLDLASIITIEFDGNGTNVGNVPAAIAVEKGDTIVISSQIPTQEGYKFLNWNSNKDGSGVTVTPGQTIENVLTSEDYYAQWGKIDTSLNINFNKNTCDNVLNIPDNIKFNKGDTVKLSDNIPLREDYIFLNWNTKKDNSGEKIYPNQMLTLDNNLELYAIWYKIPYKIVNICKEYKCICCDCKKKIAEICDCNRCC